MKTVLFFSHTAELNGAERMLLQNLNGIDRSRYSPVLVVPGKGPLSLQAEKAGFETRIIPSKWWLTERSTLWKQPLSPVWNCRSIFRLARFLKERDVQLVISNSAASFNGAMASKIQGIPHIWVIHEILGGEKPQLSFLLGRRLLVRLIRGLSCRVVVNSNASKKAFGEDEEVRLVYNGVEVPCRDELNHKQVRSEFGFSEEDVVLGLAGKICEAKGQGNLIAALGMVCDTYPRIKLLLVGEPKRPGDLASLQRLIAGWKLQERVVFTGYKENVFPFLKAMDCLFVVSEKESFGRTVIEAMSVRTPVIAVRSGGIPEIINHGQNGYLLESRDPGVLKAAIQKFIREREVFERAAESGLETVRGKFSQTKQISLFERVMEECLE